MMIFLTILIWVGIIALVIFMRNINAREAREAKAKETETKNLQPVSEDLQTTPEEPATTSYATILSQVIKQADETQSPQREPQPVNPPVNPPVKKETPVNNTTFETKTIPPKEDNSILLERIPSLEARFGIEVSNISYSKEAYGFFNIMFELHSKIQRKWPEDLIIKAVIYNKEGNIIAVDHVNVQQNFAGYDVKSISYKLDKKIPFIRKIRVFPVTE